MSIEVVKAEAVHPGAFVREELRKSGMTHLEFCRRMNWSMVHVQAMLACDDSVRISETVARNLAKAFGGSAFVWLSLQQKWDEEKPKPFVFNFDALSEKQIDVLGQISINNDLGHHPRTLESLERHGLIVGYDAVVRSLRVKRWNMPIYVHVAWCEWCSKQPGPPA